MSCRKSDSPLDGYVRHAERFGTEDVFEMASADLEPVELGWLSLRLQTIDPKWKVPNAARAALAVALTENGTDSRDVCRMAMVSRSTLWRLRQEPILPSHAASQSGAFVSNGPSAGNGSDRLFEPADGRFLELGGVVSEHLAAREPLSPAERNQLANHENVIGRGLKTFLEVGRALIAIQEQRLYRESHGTFEQYLRERWDLRRAYAYRLIGAARTAARVEEVSPNGDSPKSEAQARELAGVHSLNLLANITAWVETDGGWGVLTAKDVRRIRDEEEAAWNARQARQDEFGNLRLGIWGTAETLRRVPLGEFYGRRRAGWGDERAEEWLRDLRDQAAFIRDQADALLGEANLDLVAACAPVAA